MKSRAPQVWSRYPWTMVCPAWSRIQTLLIDDIWMAQAMVTRTEEPAVRYVPVAHHEPDTVRTETVTTSPARCPVSRSSISVPHGCAVRRAVACTEGLPSRASVRVTGPEGQARVTANAT